MVDFHYYKVFQIRKILKQIKAPNIHQICQILFLTLYIHQRDNIFTKIQIILICILTFLLFLLVFKNLIQFLNLIIPGSTHSICFVVVINMASGERLKWRNPKLFLQIFDKETRLG